MRPRYLHLSALMTLAAALYLGAKLSYDIARESRRIGIRDANAMLDRARQRARE